MRASTYKGNNSDESGVERLQEKSGRVAGFRACSGSFRQQAKRAGSGSAWSGARRCNRCGRASAWLSMSSPVRPMGKSSSMPCCSQTSQSRARRSGSNSKPNTPRAMAETYRATQGESLCAPIELRESEGGPMLHGVLIQEGRAASVRAEVFAPAQFGLGQRRHCDSRSASRRGGFAGDTDTRSERRNTNRSARFPGPRRRVQRGAQVPVNRISRGPRNPKRCGRAGNSTGIPSGRGASRRSRIQTGPRRSTQTRQRRVWL